ncbi:MAG TPA: aminotransferase class I/II-fold pyridoxal phosphate-dependent enzyme [Candidatus Limnocylindria bacterium]|nr:aminotransferase class I/II-fold pyridoxal phosphate-dependent enzyme [Candidatus Limnocylindria bacterium]
MNGFSTRAIRAATRAPRVDQQPNSVPIYQSVTFSSTDVDELAEILTEQRPGYAYARIANPTGETLAAAIAELHGAEEGFVFATGMAAIHAALLSVLTAGDRIVCTRAVYGSTRSLLANVLGGIGIRTEFVDATDLASTEAALAAEPTRVLYVETISNPTIVVADLEALAKLAHGHGAILIVDNTFASPYLCRPLELGADLVVESATKFIGGHSDVLAGVAVGNRERIARLRAIQTDTGASLAPFAAFLVLRGLTTLALRMERHSAMAEALATWLERQSGVDRVYHPALPSHPQASIARRQLRLGGGMLAFELAGGRPAGRAFIDALTIPERTASLGSIHTIVAHPPSTTHRQLSDAEIAAAGIAPGLLRCSVGLEDLDDLLADFAQALEAARDAASTEAAPEVTGAELAESAEPAAAVRP